MKHKTVNQTISMIPLDQIEVIPGLNPRFNLPNMEEIISSIRENGIQEPLKVFLNPETGKYAIVKGHRRYTASLSIATSDDLDHSEIMIPCLKYGGVPEDEMILRDHIISNSGEPFTVLEKAEIIKRYKDLGFSITEISKQIGFTYQQTYNLEILSSAPSEIKQMISEGIVSSTLIFEEFKKKRSSRKLNSNIFLIWTSILSLCKIMKTAILITNMLNIFADNLRLRPKNQPKRRKIKKRLLVFLLQMTKRIDFTRQHIYNDDRIILEIS